jgi:hypothetical protein
MADRPTADAPPAGRWRRRLITAAAIVAVASPALRDHDSIPLSTYPMYATARGDVATLATAVGVDGRGERHRLSMAIIARTDDPLIAESTVRGAVREGRAAELCRQIAGRVGEPIHSVEVVEERHDLVRRAAGEPSLIDRQVHATCARLP